MDGGSLRRCYQSKGKHMTKDDIIKMAREAGFEDYEQDEMCIRFANLVATAKAEECAKVCEQLAVQQDRDVRDECAAAIRARSQA
jgi:hypothetical protein